MPVITRTLLLGLALSGCTWIGSDDVDERYDQDGDGVPWPDDCDDTSFAHQDEVAVYADTDGDGYGDASVSVMTCTGTEGFVADTTDCDDSDASVNPTADEICNGIDDDCDRDIDDADTEGGSDAATWYADSDGDGYADADTTAVSCEQPSGYIAAPDDGSSWDCDDSDGAVGTGSEEVCNGVDDDCDGDVDDDDSNGAADATTWYADDDEDGYGAEDDYLDRCEQPSGYVAEDAAGFDCDDTDDAVNPGATEVCDDDDLDEDCDGLVDDDDDSLDTSTQVSFYVDADEDGWGDADGASITACEAADGYAVEGDCDDGDAAVNPDATEVCDDGDVDEDCDGLVDDDDDSLDTTTVGTFYADADGDGYGDATSTADACDASTGWVADDTDCDDTDGDVNPDAAEVCDDLDVDEDCDGVSDDDDSSVLGTSTWVTDSDGDGYGDEDAVGTTACEGPSGTVADATDCDDGDADISPGATEVCENGVDEDCSGVDDDCFFSGTLTTADASARVLGAAAADAAGTSLSGVGDIDGDGTLDLLIGAPGNDDGGTGAGAAYVVLGPLSGSLDLDSADAVLTGSTGGAAGSVVAQLGDVDGDGYSDVAIGGEDAGSSTTGQAWLLLGPLSGTSALSDADTVYTGATSGDDFGEYLAGGEDLDGDGDGDLVISAPNVDGDNTDDGLVYLFSGPLTAWGALSTTDADGTLAGEGASDFAGEALVQADITGDGVADLLVGVPGYGSYAGAVYVIDMSSGMPAVGTSLSDADVALTSSITGQQLGSALAAGDLDGDGYDDLAAGAPNDGGAGTDAGAVFVRSGPITASSGIGTGATVLRGEDDGALAGTALAIVPDQTEDGTYELVVGAPGYLAAASELGAAYVVYGPVSTSGTLGDADAVFTGSADGDMVGSAVGGAGDVDGDGYPDLWVGGSGDDTAASNAGAAWLLLVAGE